MKFLLIWLKVIIEVGIFPPCPPLWVKWLTRDCVLARVALVQNKSSPRVGLDQEGDFRRKRGGVEMLNIIGSIQPPTDRNTGDNNGSCHGIASEFLFWSGEFIKTVRNDFYILWSCLAGVKRDKQFWETFLYHKYISNTECRTPLCPLWPADFPCPCQLKSDNFCRKLGGRRGNKNWIQPKFQP